ncbi:hypothetical protein BCR44DRAFT_81011 [Catenaria anguillulae PL171]|uniref:PAS domain-containing protein n=1 Tax=Catenaria anguillulae PL171 TaxID=765915 RepID=A0A1Y2I268_9FUNG|nr:hypothetical protein BCR44DRAFT_81011 [Catenaria anguillulae PL171]
MAADPDVCPELYQQTTSDHASPTCSQNSMILSSAGDQTKFIPATPQLGDSTVQPSTRSVLRQGHDRIRNLFRCFRLWVPWVAAVLTIIVGVGCSIGLYFWFRSVETGTFERDFASIRRICVRSLESVMGVRCFQHLRNFAAFTYATPELTQDALTTFGERSSFDPKIIYSINICVVVPKNQSAALSQFYGFKAYSSANSSDLIKNDTVDVYPALIYPLSRGNGYLGWNLLSDPLRRVAVMRSLSPGTWSVSDPLAMRATGETGFGAWYHVPPRQPKPSNPFPQWIASVGLSFNLLFSSTLDRIFTNANDSDIAVYVDFETHKRVFAYEPTGPDHALLDSTRAATEAFHGFNAKWPVTFVPTSRYVSNFFTAVPWVVFACTMGVFVLLSDVVRRATARFMVSKQMLKRLETQTQLLSSMQQYSRAVLEAIPDGLFMLDAHGRVLSANDAALKLTGYQLDDFVRPMPFTVLLDESSKASVRARGRARQDASSVPEACDSRIGSESVSSSVISDSPGSSRPATPRTAAASSVGPQSSRLRRRRRPTSDPSPTPTPSSSPCCALPSTASFIHVENDSPVAPTPTRTPPAPAISPDIRPEISPSMYPESDTQCSLTDLVLEPGDHEVILRRKDGSTFFAQLSVSQANDPHVDPDAPLGDLLSLHNRMRTFSFAPPSMSSEPSPYPNADIPHAHEPNGYESVLLADSAHQLPTGTFHQIVLFHDITSRVESMRLVAAMEKQATDATEAKQHLLQFLIQAMTVPVEQMMHDLDVIARAAEDRVAAQPLAGGARNDFELLAADLVDAKAAAKHITNVLDDVAVYAGVNCLDKQQLNNECVIEPQGDHPSQCSKCGGCGPQGKLLSELVDACIEPGMLDAMRDRGIIFTMGVAAAARDVRMPPGFSCTACKLIYKFVALGAMLARPASLMTLALSTDKREDNHQGDGGEAAEQLHLHFLATISAFDPMFPTSVTANDLDLSVGSRGSAFGNVALTWAALIQLVERNGGQIKQTRVATGVGLVMNVVLAIPQCG